jgi:WD40 repeat protein
VVTGEHVLTVRHTAWGFTEDGRRFAGGGQAEVALCEFLQTDVFRPLTGHPTVVDRVAWSRDNRHLASLDAAFGLRVWDAVRGVLLGEFDAPRGRYYAPNAGLALSDDGAQLAYVNGGESQVILWDVKTRKRVEAWKLRPGYECLTCVGGARFLLAREEAAAGGKGGLRSAAYELARGKPLREVREVRKAVEGERGFFHSGLTPDGRYYWWSGPREPQKAYRVEVREVATGRLVREVPIRPEKPVHSIAACLSPDGRFLWAEGDERGPFRCDMSGTEPPVLSEKPRVMAEGASWQAHVSVEHVDSAQTLALERGDSGGIWLELRNHDLSGPSSVSFSPNGRYLILGDAAGELRIADLEALKEQVTAFEKELRRK